MYTTCVLSTYENDFFIASNIPVWRSFSFITKLHEHYRTIHKKKNYFSYVQLYLQQYFYMHPYSQQSRQEKKWVSVFKIHNKIVGQVIRLLRIYKEPAALLPCVVVLFVLFFPTKYTCILYCSHLFFFFCDHITSTTIIIIIVSYHMYYLSDKIFSTISYYHSCILKLKNHFVSLLYSKS